MGTNRGPAPPARHWPGPTHDQEAKDRIEEGCRLDRQTGCWIWRGFRPPLGAPQVDVKGQRYTVQRLAYLTYIGPLAPGEVVRQCPHGGQLCANPEHLRRPDESRILLRRRAFDEPIVFRLLEMIDSGLSAYAAGKLLGISGGSAANIARGESYKDVIAKYRSTRASASATVSQ